jgi:hypothetical protein
MLIHRLFALSDRLEEPVRCDAMRALACGLLSPEERAGHDRSDEIVRLAVDAWSRARGRADVVEALAGERLYEVPFSILFSRGPAPQVTRGTIDCVVRKPDGTLTVVEFKTGRRESAHERQLELYMRAARALHPDTGVHGLVLYV